MRIPQPSTPYVVPLHPVQALRSGRGGEIDVPYIHFLDGRVPEAFEPSDLAEDGVREVHLSARVKLLDYFIGETFHTHFFNAYYLQIPFLGRKSVNMSVKFLDAARATQKVGSRVATWTENICVHSWGPYPTSILHNVSTIKRHAYDVPVTPPTLTLRANHKRLIMNCVERRRTLHRELLARIHQDMRDEVSAVLSNDYYDGCI